MIINLDPKRKERCLSDRWFHKIIYGVCLCVVKMVNFVSSNFYAILGDSGDK